MSICTEFVMYTCIRSVFAMCQCLYVQYLAQLLDNPLQMGICASVGVPHNLNTFALLYALPFFRANAVVKMPCIPNRG